MLIQYSVYGYTLGGIRKRMKTVETINGGFKLVVYLHHGWVSVCFDILELSSNHALLGNGFKPVMKINKKVAPC